MSGAYVVVDTSVLSAVERMAYRGYNPTDIQQRRAAHFLKWLLRYKVDLVNTTFAMVEGSGFHAGGVSPYNVLRRSLPFEGLRCLDEPSLQAFLMSRKGAVTRAPHSFVEDHYVATLDQAADLLLTTFGPAYLVSLQLRLCHERGTNQRETSHRVAILLAEELNFVPAIPWLVALLACFGKPSVRQAMAQNVFKHTNPDKRKAILSGAWDLAYLQLLSELRRTIGTSQDGGIGQPVLVTDDDALAALAAQIHAHGPLLGFDPEMINPAYRVDCKAEVTMMQLRRQFDLPSKPVLDKLIGLAGGLEDALLLPHFKMMVQAPEYDVEFDVDVMLALFRALQIVDARDRLEQLMRTWRHGDTLVQGLLAAQAHVEGNAKVRNRSPSESLERVVETINSRPGVRGDLPMIGEMIVIAWVGRSSVSATSLLQQVEVIEPSLYGSALVYVAEFLLELLADTAAAQDESLETLLDRLVANCERIKERQTI